MANTNGGFDLNFSLSDIPTLTLDLITDIVITTGSLTARLGFSFAAGALTVSLEDSTNSVLESAVGTYDADQTDLRILWHNQFCTIYINGSWLHTFSVVYADHPQLVTLGMQLSTQMWLSGIVVRELWDWRDAIYIELEQNAQGAIGFIIQQRPIEYYGRSDGSLAFYYDPAWRPLVDLSYVAEVEKQERDNSQVSSDGVAYYANVDTVMDTATAEQEGFITRVFRVPELDTGADRAVRVIQKVARQQLRNHTLKGRINPALEAGDHAHVEATLSGTQTNEEIDAVVERVNLSIQSSSQNISGTMTAEGRDAN